jgi:DNA-binding IclR family transcriptional regulator
MLRKLTDAVHETSNVQLLMGDFTRVIASIECDQTLRVGNREGQNLPAEESSGGRALLGRGLETISDTRVAINDQHIESGITAIGVAIPTTTLANRLAVSVAMPSARFSRPALASIVTHLTETAHAIGRVLDNE